MPGLIPRDQPKWPICRAGMVKIFSDPNNYGPRRTGPHGPALKRVGTYRSRVGFAGDPQIDQSNKVQIHSLSSSFLNAISSLFRLSIIYSMLFVLIAYQISLLSSQFNLSIIFDDFICDSLFLLFYRLC